MNKKLFRDKAVDAQKSKWIGEVILISPFSFTVMTIGVAIFTIIIVLFLFLGSYTKKTTVQGQLMPDTGLIRVYAVDGGTINKKFIQEGQTVKMGDPLYQLQMTRFSNSGNYNESLAQQIQVKKQTLATEKDQLKNLHQNSYEQTISEIQSLKLQLAKVDGLIQEQKQRLALALENMNRYQQLKEKDYISVEEFQTKQDIYFNQKLTLQSYERDRIAKKSELANKELILQSLQSKLNNELNNVDRQLASNQQELIENKARDSLLIKANASGVVTSLNAEVGQQVSSTTPLLNIVPAHSQLEAHLYIPSSAIGFVKLNQSIRLRFQAYPYQRFGQAQGNISSISETTMNTQELTNLGEFNNSLAMNKNESVYLIKVKLQQQSMKAYGENKRLKVGMTFDADVLQEKRKLYEWVLEPLYSITGKL